ncbi:acetylornithine deacetylase [Lacticaseibacillus chiayiensis]|nr:acetylornithine deacetylase [Lacticaseibacillus chiayiensis]
MRSGGFGLTDEEQQVVNLLKAMVQIPSVGAKEGQVADLIEAYLAPELQAGLIRRKRITYAPGRDNLVLTVGDPNAKRWLGVDGHMDVVDAGDESKWEFPPFSAHIKDGRLYGRGATDMKSGLAAVIVALKKVAHTQLDHGIQLMATVGEEIDNYGARQLAAAGYGDRLAGLLVAEPGNSNVDAAERGIIDYTLTAHGKAAHSSRPDLGANAIHGLFAFANAALTATAPLQAKDDPILGNATHNIDMIRGGNQINSLPESAYLRGNIRTTMIADNDAFIQALKQAAKTAVPKGVHLSLSIDSVLGPAAASPDNALIETVQQARQHVGLDRGAVAYRTGITDAALFYHDGLDLAIYGPENDTSHETNEYVTLQDVFDSVKVYKDVFMNY